jgi:AcrR family transcriptional regulator
MAMKLHAARPLSEASPDCRPPRRRRKEARPSELTAAALALFVEKGFAGTRLDDVAARAGVSKGTLYLYFESKEALFKAVIEEGMVAALAAAEQRLSDFHGSAAELLQQLLFGWWEQIGQTPMAGVSKLIACESSNFPEVAQYYHDRVLTRGRALAAHDAAARRGQRRVSPGGHGSPRWRRPSSDCRIFTDRAELLQQLLFGWWEQIGQTPMAGVTKLIACESSNFPEVAQYYHDRVLTRGRALLRTTLQRGVASGEFRPVDIETAIDVIMAPLLMLAISRFSLGFCNQRTTPETYLRTHFELLVNGLRGQRRSSQRRVR